MLQILESLPENLLSTPPEGLADVLGGPTLLHLPGTDSGAGRGALFVSTLLHGNETTGWDALRQLLLEFEDGVPPRPLTIFIANVQAAKARLRHLDGQPDFNRIWDYGPGRERDMARRVLHEIKILQPIACLDIHNTSGNNPMYACVHRLDDDSFFWSEHNLPLLNDVLAAFECETVRSDDGGDHAIFLGRVLAAHEGHAGDPLIFFRGRYRHLSGD